MPHLQPPPGTVTRKKAVEVLLREKVITSPAMLAKIKGINRVVLEGRSHGFYPEDQLLTIINNRRQLNHVPPLTSIFDEEHHIEVRRATSEDMNGVYEVAHKLFGHTTFAEDRIPLVRKVPEGNLVVTDNNTIVGYAHIQPLKQEPLQSFLNGEFRGNGITTEHLDPPAPGKVIDVLVKSIGVYHELPSIATRYSRDLFSGLQRELIDWGNQGYIIHRVYATSETPSGIEMALSIPMIPLGKIPTTRGKKRFAFMIDPLTSERLIFRKYRTALDKWRSSHPGEYEQAWQIWNKQP